MFLSRDVLKQRILKDGIVSDYDVLDKQLTANGIDLRICAIIEIVKGGRLAIVRENNSPPVLGRAFVLKGYENRLEGYKTAAVFVGEGCIQLKKNIPYFVITCEKFHTPKNLMFHLQNRSSLFRFIQGSNVFGFGEAGYEGFLVFMMVSFLDSEIELGARFVQASFSELRGEAQYAEQYETNQQGGKLF